MSESLERVYEPSDCITFRKTNEMFGGLSNMAPGFRVRVNDHLFLTIEALYQACRFPNMPDLQEFIVLQKSPMTMKMKIKPYKNESRPDWQKVRVRIMRWCLRVKLSQNLRSFGSLLLATEEKLIVEDSRNDCFWGAIRTQDKKLVGANVLGRLLMELREELRIKGLGEPFEVQPPEIPDFLLFGCPIAPVRSQQTQHPIERRDAISWVAHHDAQLRSPAIPVTQSAARALQKLFEVALTSGATFNLRVEISSIGGIDPQLLHQLQLLASEPELRMQVTTSHRSVQQFGNQRLFDLPSKGSAETSGSRRVSFVNRTNSSSKDRS